MELINSQRQKDKLIRSVSTSGVSNAIQKTINAQEQKAPLIQKIKPAEFTIKIANTLEEREEAFHLAYQTYIDKGYISRNSNEWLINDYDKDFSTTIFIVKDRSEKVVASATLVFNDSSFLPTEKIYYTEIENLKSSGSKIVEVSRLVINPDHRNSKEILVLLFNYMFIYGYHVKHFDSTIVQVNPRHIDYYKKLLNFKEIGEEKLCPSVSNAPAILLYLPLSSYYSEVLRNSHSTENDKKNRSLYPYFIKAEQEKLVAYYLEKQATPISYQEKIHFKLTESGIHNAVRV